MKVATACQQCRASKRKCWQPKAQEACTQCYRSKIECAFGPLPRPDADVSQQPKLSKSSISISASPLGLDDVLVESLVENYIRYIHDRPHSIFHLPILRAAVKDKKLPPALLLALLSFGARFHPDAAVVAWAPEFLDDSKQHFHRDLENVCIENIQACILLASLSAALLRPSSDALYLGIAIRMAEILRINVCDSRDTVVMQELKRRIWWSLFNSDHWCSAGNSIPRKMDSFSRMLDLPMDESIFNALDETQMILHVRPEPGLFAYMITLVEIFGPIQDLNWRFAHHNLEDDVAEAAVLSLMTRLDAWEDSLPAHVRYNQTNLDAYRARGLGGIYMALHVGYYHFATLIYYQYLDASRAATTRTKAFAERCRYYATSQSVLLKTARELGDCPLMYPGIGHCAVISSSVLLHTLLFGWEGETIAAENYLTSNFECLKELSLYWPSLELIVRRLTVFQRACLQHVASQIFKFDKRMVTFLLEYHQEMDDKLPLGIAYSFPVTPDDHGEQHSNTVT